MIPRERLERALRRATDVALAARQELDGVRAKKHAPLAIVGVGLRLPGGAEDLDALFRVLADGADTLRAIPRERFDVSMVYDPDPDRSGTTYVRHASLLDDVAGFDAAVFGISPREALPMDPQHRLLLEATWTALEDAGFDPRAIRGSNVGVFVGIGPNEYAAHRSRTIAEADAYDLTGTLGAFAAGRLGYHFGLQGPALSVDTACSSSLVALHIAAEQLRAGRCELAIAGGVQVIADPDAFVLLSRTRAVSRDGRCKTFSAHADGYGRGEGVGVIALMHLDQAVAQGRRVLGVVRGTAVNHDGASSGITAPNGTSQRRVLRAALEDARLAPTDIDFVECHGTGTALGDPIEVQALEAVYGQDRALEPLRIGAVKATLGHLESAAGIAGVLKVLASFRHEALPPNRYASPPNPHLAWNRLGVKVVEVLSPWPRRNDRPRRAAVSAFGLSGTNAHVILEEPPPLPNPASAPLPKTVFSRQRYWLDAVPSPAISRADAEFGRSARTWPFSGSVIDLADGGALHLVELGPAAQPYLADHLVYGRIVVAGAVHLSVLLAVAAHHYPAQDLELSDVQFHRALTFGSPNEKVTLHVQLQPPTHDGTRKATLASKKNGLWTTHATAVVGPATAPIADPAQVSFERLSLDPHGGALAEERLSALHVDWGPRWRWLADSAEADGLRVGRLAPPAGVATGDAPMPPPLIDVSFVLAVGPIDGDVPFLPFRVELLRVRAGASTATWACGTTTEAGTILHVGDLAWFDAEARAVARMYGFTAHRAPADRFLPSTGQRTDLYQLTASQIALPSHAVDATSPVVVATTDDFALPDGSSILIDVQVDQPNVARLLTALQARLARDAPLAKLAVVTRGAVSLGLSGPLANPDHAALWGLLRSLRHEQLDLEVTLLDSDTHPESIERIGRAVHAREPEAVLRDGRLFRLALTPLAAGEPDALGASSPETSVLVRPRRFDPNGTVLMTGGTGGLGRIVAEHLVRRHGVKHLLLLSRSGAAASDAGAWTARLRELGAETLTITACDVRDREALANAIATIPAARPLTGVLHLAGQSRDATFQAQTVETLSEVFGAKLLGARHLDELSRSYDTVGCFVLFSSLAGVLGSPGQAGYAAANAGLDALAARRRAQGFPALSLAWGPWDEVGMAAELPSAHKARLARNGISLLSVDAALALLDAALDRADDQLAAFRLDPQALGASGSVPPLLTSRVRRAPPTTTTADVPPKQIEALTTSEPQARRARLLEIVRTEAASVLHLSSPESVPATRPLEALGLDSLMAIELRKRIGDRVGAVLPSSVVFDHPTPAALASALDVAIGGAQRVSASVTRPVPAPAEDAIAIVSMACRFPGGVDDPDGLWALLERRGDAIGPFPTDRGWQLDGLYDPNPERAGTTYTRGGGFLIRPDLFDARLFGISTREAEAMDPQQRLLLETTWEALEGANIAPTSLENSATGLFLGVSYDDYQRLAPATTANDGYVALGTARSIAAGRVAYAFGLQGPAVTVDTACSSSLVALHLAARALRHGECRLALAGGATVFATPEPLVIFSRLRALSPDGHCKAFAEGADGAGWAEGVGMLVLERLSDARRAGHPVLAILRGSAVNQDGRSQGLTAPNGPSQERLIRAALEDARLTAADVDLIEAHGTGTALGDPIEAHALLATYGAVHDPSSPVWLGTIKSNVGHTQSASGVAGVIKAILALRHGILPATLHADRPSSRIDWSSGRLALLTESRPWPPGRVRRAAVSSFGISGTNAHVVLEEAPDPPVAPRRAPDGPLPFVLSGHTPEALAAQAGRLATAMAGSRAAFVDIANTLACGRAALSERAIVMAASSVELQAGLEALARGEPSSHVRCRTAVDGPAVVEPRIDAWLAGDEVDWAAFYAPYEPAAVALPTYAFQRRPLWLKPAAPEREPERRAGRFALSGVRADLPDGQVTHTVGLDVDLQPYLDDHRLFDRRVVAGMTYVSMLLAIGEAHWPGCAIALHDVQFLRPLVLESPVRVCVHLRPREGEAGFDAVVASQGASGWTQHASARLAPDNATFEFPSLATERDAMPSSTPFPRDRPLRRSSATFGTAWLRIDATAVRGATSFGHAAPPVPSSEECAPVHPALLDNAINLPVFAMPLGDSERSDGGIYLPFALSRVWWSGQGALGAWILRRADGGGGMDEMADLWLWSGGGAPLLHIKRYQPRLGRADRFLARVTLPLSTVRWEPFDAPPPPTSQSSAIVMGDAAAVARIAASLRATGTTVDEWPGWNVPEAAVAQIILAGAPRRDTQVDVVGCAIALQAVLATPALAGAHVVWVTECAQRVTTGEPCEGFEQAAIWGLLRTARAEYPDRKFTLVDDPDGDASRWLGAIEHGELATRDAQVYVPKLETHTAGSAGSIAFGQGTVLVTGGTTGVGAAIARHIVTQHGVRSLVLASRRGADTPGVKNLAAELRTSGSEVRVVSCDVSVRDQVGDLLATVPDLTAVIHAAGVLDDATLAKASPQSFARAWGPKVQGAIHLDALTGARPLTRFVLVSSLAGTVGNAGQAAYAAANAALDALAARRVARGLPATSIAYGPWQGVGMTGPLSADIMKRLRERGVEPLSLTDALALFDASLHTSAPALVLAPFNRNALARLLGAQQLLPAVPPEVAAAPARASAPALASVLGALSRADRRDRVRELVRREVASVLRSVPSELRSDLPLEEQGLDSLMAVEVRARLVEATGISLLATALFDHPTIDALVEFLDGQMKTVRAREAVGPAPEKWPNGAEPIAIVSMACRFPGDIDSPEALWNALLRERDAIGEVPARRFPIDPIFDPDRNAIGKSYSRWGGFLGDLDAFDAPFFRMSAREARSVDPQARLLLETTWEAAERAGRTIESLRGSNTGVYVGICGNEFYGDAVSDLAHIDHHTLTGTMHSALVGRISYWLGLTGPSFPVDTACSSSLLAVHLAVQALRLGECDQAFAGGVNVLLSEIGYVYFSRLGALSPTGQCRTFSGEADGYVRAEGCGMLFLRRLSDALGDGDPIVAVIRGSAVNQDGRSNGLTAPNGTAQRTLIRKVLAHASIQPNTVDVVECHGTGTPLGDPIEVMALAEAYGVDRREDHPLVIGSIKSNIGHAEAAAGVAGLMKLALALKHRTIPRSLHFDPSRPNPNVPWATIPLRVADKALPWAHRGHARRGGVSAFAFQGTNVHVVLEEAPERPAPMARSEPIALPVIVSAQSEAALRAQAGRLAEHLANRDDRILDVAATLATGRSDLEYRVAIAARPDARGSLVGSLRDIAAGRGSAEIARRRRDGKLVFLFTGQGSQRVGMGRELHRSFPKYAENFDAVCSAFSGLLPGELADVVFGDAERLGQTAWSQPALFAVEVALYRLWESVGLVPDLLVGHSIGEIAAAHVAGVLSLDDACRLVAERARLMESAPASGTMAAVQATEAELAPLLEPHRGRIDIAAVNGPRSLVISGDTETVRAVVAKLEAMQRSTRVLDVGRAFHSPHMDGLPERLEACVRGLELRPPAVPIVSTVTGALATAEMLRDPVYWGRQLRATVRLDAALCATETLGADIFVELGPSAVLAPLVRGSLSAARARDVLAIATLTGREGDAEALSRAFAQVHAQGRALDWRSFFASLDARRSDVPTYAFQRARHWLPKTSTVTTTTPEPPVPTPPVTSGKLVLRPLRDAMPTTPTSASVPSAQVASPSKQRSVSTAFTKTPPAPPEEPIDIGQELASLYRLQRRRLETLAGIEETSGRREPGFVEELRMARELLERTRTPIAAPTVDTRAVFDPQHPFLRDHVVHGKPLLGFDVHLECMFAAARLRLGDRITLQDVTLVAPVFGVGPPVVLRQVVSGDTNALAIELRDAGGGRTSHCVAHPGAMALGETITPAALPNAAVLDGGEIYKTEQGGVFFGPYYRTIRWLRHAPDRATVRLELTPEALPGANEVALPVALLNGLVAGAAIAFAERESHRPMVPTHIASVEVAPAHLARAFGQVQWLQIDSESATFDADLLDENGTIVARLEGVTLRPAERLAPRPSEPATGTASERPSTSRHRDTLAIVCSRIAGALLLHAPVDPDARFDELGLDSIIGSELAKDLGDRLGVSVNARDLYEFPNARALAGLIDARKCVGTRSNTDPIAQARNARAFAGSDVAIELLTLDDGCVLEVFRSGNGGSPVLLLPGWGSASIWRHQFRSLGRAATVVSLSYPGIGQSPAHERARTPTGLAAAAAEVIDRLGFGGPIDVVGFSMGGVVAILLARRPGRVRRLALVSTRVALESTEVHPRALLADFARDHEGSALAAEGFDYDLLKANEVQPHGRIDVHEALASIEAPTLVVVGDHDTITSVDDAQNIVRGIAGATLQIVPGVGHFLPLFAADPLDEVLIPFLTRSLERP